MDQPKRSFQAFREFELFVLPIVENLLRTR